MFKFLFSLLAICLSIASTLKGQTAEAHFYGSVVSNGNQTIPEALIEVLERSEKFSQNDTCIERLYASFQNRGEYKDSINWTTCQKNREVKINKGTELFHQFKLSNEEQKGYLFGQKGRIVVTELVDSLLDMTI